MIKRLALAIAFGMVLSVAQAESITLTVTAMRELAFKAAQAGYADQALDMTAALLTRDPKDATALIIRAQALRSLGRLAEAQKAAKTAWSAATTDKSRFGAAMAMAQALSSDGRRTSAQLWLRRAAEYAPSERALAMAKRDFGYVKSRNPWTLDITGQASPASNVNNGSRRDYMTVSGLPFEFEIAPESQALSGFELGLGVAASYRFAPKADQRETVARFGFSGQAVALSASAKAAAPLAKASDYSYLALEAGLSHRRPLGETGTNMLRLSGTFGHNWYGGAVLSDYLRLSMGLDHSLSDRAALSFGLSADMTARADSAKQSSDRLALSVRYAVATGADQQDRLSLQFEAGQTASASDEVRAREASLSLDWRKGVAVAGIGLAAGLELSQQVFADSHYVTGRREDLTMQANLAMTFEKVD